MKRTVREYFADLEQENATQEPIKQQELVSTTDPDAVYLTKGNRAAELGYFNNYLVDNHSCIIVGVQATVARLIQESVAARDMITRFSEQRGQLPQTLTADTSYGNGELLHWLEEHGITPQIPVKECPLGKSDLYGLEHFRYRALRTIATFARKATN